MLFEIGITHQLNGDISTVMGYFMPRGGESIHIYICIVFLKIILNTITQFQVFLTNTNNLQTVKWFQVFLYNTNNLYTVIWFKITSKDKHLWTIRASSKVKLATVVEGDPKASFSIATTLRCRGGRNTFPWIALLYPWSSPYNAEC